MLQDSVNTGVNTVIDGTSSLDVQVCFAAGTPIRLSNGEVIPVEEAKPGMKVRVPNENDPEGEHFECEIVEVYHNPPSLVTRLKIESESSGKQMTIRGTETHRFYVVGFGWKPIRDLEIGDRFLSENGEKTLVLIEKVLEPKPVPVYNFQVKGCHTYFVGETVEESVLVHNEDGCGGSVDPLDELDNLIYRTRNPIVKINTIAEIRRTEAKIEGAIDTTVATLDGGTSGLIAGGAEVTYKASIPIAWVCWKPEFVTMANLRDNAWSNSGLNGTATQTATQASANIGVGAGYALLLKGPIIRAIGDKTVPMSTMAEIEAACPGFLQMSSYDKGIWLLTNRLGIALYPYKEGLVLGTTTPYPVRSYHYPSVETVILGVPTSSATSYWIITGLNPNNDNDNKP